jgi:hypothetical protein
MEVRGDLGEDPEAFEDHEDPVLVARQRFADVEGAGERSLEGWRDDVNRADLRAVGAAARCLGAEARLGIRAGRLSVGGIPIRMRSIQVNIDKPNFTINPTNCNPLSVESQGIGDQGTVSDFFSRYQVVNCETLPFKPRMKVRQLGGKGQTKRTKNPRLRFDLFTRNGDANLKSLAVTLPKSFQIDQRHLFNICSKSQLNANRCKGRQPMGNVSVKSPLLDQPLKGPAYAVSGFGKLPHLVFILDGQVTIMPQAESSSVNDGQLRTNVPVIPDVPIGHFRLTLLGGAKGYLVNSKNLCRHAGKIRIDYIAQNGKKRAQRVRPKIPCGKKKRRHTRHHR